MSGMRKTAVRYQVRIVLVFGLIVSLPSWAQDTGSDGAVLVHANRCYACHHETEALLGPPYKAIAARHKSRKEVMVDVLAEKIILGGGGNWGFVPMVPNEHVTETDARRIAQWILDLEP